MKLLANLMLIALVASGALALPARNPQDDAEVISVPRRSESADPVFRDFQGVIDTGVGYPFLQPNPPPFAHNLGFFDSFEDILRRFRARLWPVVPSEGGSDDSNDSSESGLGSAFGFGLRPLIPLKPLDPKNANTTSTVKVVDGHKVEVNETVYGDENNVFKVRVVNVRPLASGEEVAEGVSSSQGGVGGQQAPQLPNYGPSTSAPRKRGEFDESEEDDRREPLEKQPADNEVRDIDSAQHSTNIRAAETTATTTISTLAPHLPTGDAIAESQEDSAPVEPLPENSHLMAAVLEDIENMEQLEAVSHLAQDIAAVADESEAQTIALNEETETLHHSEGEMESDSHSDSDSDIEDHHESAAIESIGVESPAAEAEAPQAAPQEPQKQKEREELESSDDEESGAGEHVEMSPTFNAEWETLAEDLANKNDAANDLSNHIDESFEHLAPIDLSHDIAVNDIAAANAQFPYNPDAELIDISNVQMLPKFEKLTLAIAPAVEQQQQPEEEELEMAETLLQ